MRFLVDAIKFVLPNSVLKKIRPIGHGFLAILASIYYGNPSSEMVVVGVTGTSGKSSTVQLLSKILNFAGMKTGYITTVSFFDGEKEFVNKHGLSMPGWFMLQRNLRAMVTNKCKVAIVEATSEGLQINRHLGIDFDGAIFTNLSEAHLDAHGGFENYRAAKGKLFQAVLDSKTKTFSPDKFADLNFDDPNIEFFKSFGIPNTFGISFQGKMDAKYQGENPKEEGNISFDLQGVHFELNLLGKFNAYNALSAVAAANNLGVDLNLASAALKDFKNIPGRMEEIPNNKGIKIYVDYAPEPSGMENVLKVLSVNTKGKLIHVFGSTGGHRDVKKRFEFGKIAAEYDDVIVITNDDVYDSDPEKIAEDIQKGINDAANRKANQRVEVILDRREAIQKSIEMAEVGDTLVFTGKGSEQFLVLPGNKRIEWDDREVIKEYLK